MGKSTRGKPAIRRSGSRINDKGRPLWDKPKDIGETSVTSTIPEPGKRESEKPGGSKKKRPSWVEEERRKFGIE